MSEQIRLAILTATGFAALPAIAAADSSGSGNGTGSDAPISIPNTDPGEFLGSMVWVMVALAIVIALILVVIKWLSKRSKIWGANRSMRSLGGVGLGQNSSMQVVEIAGRLYIVGVGQNITLLDKLSPEEAEDVIAALEGGPENAWSPKDFAELLKKWKNRKTERQEPGKEQWNSPSSFQQMLESKLEKGANRKQQLESMLKDHNTNERLMDDEK
ncbi:FliO/MopB family protein [Paenibacillus sp. M.A.Huq-81]